MAGLLSVTIVAIVVVASVGSVPVAPEVTAVILADELLGLVEAVPGSAETPNLYNGRGELRTIVVTLRMPRVLVGAIVGFALGVAGAVMQGFFRNPMADPAIIGVSSGAAVGAVAVIALPVTVPLAGITGAAFVGALTAAFAVYAIATKHGRTGVARLLLAGIAIQTFLGAVTSYLVYSSGDDLRTAVFWLMGNLTHRGWDHVVVALPVVLLGSLELARRAPELNVMSLGEDGATSLGVDVERTKRRLIAVSSLVTAAAVAVSGVIGFVGLIVPHVVRLGLGPDHRIVVPASGVVGAVFLVLADAVARSVLGGAELPVGIVTAFVGVPFFLWLLRRREVYEL
jgi:iron complex transport system permease protein